MCMDARKRKGVGGEDGDNHGDRYWCFLPAAMATPACNSGGLGARWRWWSWGNGADGGGVDIGARRGSRNGLNGLIEIRVNGV